MDDLKRLDGIRLAKDIDALTDFHEHVRVVRDLLPRYLSEERRAGNEKRLDEIEQRAADPNLNLAVIGEFCSGKSTFINALIRSRLLKASCVATTASVTRIRYGPALAISASFADSKAITATQDDFIDLRQALAKWQPEVALDDSLKELLDRLTSDPPVAQHVGYIDITLPLDQLVDNLVILDTPGIGAGTVDATRHDDLTQRVVVEVADCALVLIPSEGPLTATLIRFLESCARPFLHRCIFVMTAMDRQTEEERAGTLAYVRSKLREKLDLESPLLLESAAMAMIPGVNLPKSLEDSLPYWRSGFVEVEAAVQASLVQGRTLIVAERLIRLLQALVGGIEGELAEATSGLAEEELQLRENSVATLEEVLSELVGRSATGLEDSRASIKQTTQTQGRRIASDATQWAYGLIQRMGSSIKHYSTMVHPQVLIGIAHYGSQYSEVTNREVAGLRAQCEALAATFVRRFEESYRDLRSLGVAVPVAEITVAPVPQPGSFRSTLALTEEQRVLDQKRGQVGGAVGGTFGGTVGALPFGCLGYILGAVVVSALGYALGGNDTCGAILYALIGFVVGGLAGAVVGVAAAAFAGIAVGSAVGGWFGPRLQDRQLVLRTHLASDISSFFEEAGQQFLAHIDATVDSVLASFRSAVERHLSEYGSTVARLRTDHERQQEAVERRLADARIDAGDLRHRAARLEAIRLRLSHLGVPGAGSDHG